MFFIGIVSSVIDISRQPKKQTGIREYSSTLYVIFRDHYVIPYAV